MGCLAAEASLILLERFSASRFWDEIQRYQATQFSLVGVMVGMLLNQPESTAEKNHLVRWVNTGGIPKGSTKVFEERFGVKVIEGYGLTECPLVCQNPYDGVCKDGSIGLPAKHPDPQVVFTEMKIVDDQGQELPANSVGEIVVRSPVIMRGYYLDPAKTEESIKDGWFYTGDYGFRDADGYFFFYERKKELIRRRGENISPAEIEAIINKHPKILESAVVPVKAVLGEDEVKGIVVPREGESIAAEEVINWCQERLAYFKVPSMVEISSGLPKTETGKIARSVLKKKMEGGG
jgi:crotonobetaine/carnitine-CoA ligase